MVCSAAVFLALGACQQPGPVGDVSTSSTHDFEATAVGALPAGFRVAETNGRGMTATWAVAVGGAGGSEHCVQVQETGNERDTYNLLLSEAAYPADLRISVKVRSDRGEEDQGGGVLWRARGVRDYYVARWNPLEDNLRVYKVEGGVRTQFDTAKVIVPPGQWHDLVVTMQGDHMVVAFDGQDLLDHHDSTFTGPGRVGLWTKADAAASFDDLAVSALDNVR